MPASEADVGGDTRWLLVAGRSLLGSGPNTNADQIAGTATPTAVIAITTRAELSAVPGLTDDLESARLERE